MRVYKIINNAFRSGLLDLERGVIKSGVYGGISTAPDIWSMVLWAQSLEQSWRFNGSFEPFALPDEVVYIAEIEVSGRTPAAYFPNARYADALSQDREVSFVADFSDNAPSWSKLKELRLLVPEVSYKQIYKIPLWRLLAIANKRPMEGFTGEMDYSTEDRFYSEAETVLESYSLPFHKGELETLFYPPVSINSNKGRLEQLLVSSALVRDAAIEAGCEVIGLLLPGESDSIVNSETYDIRDIVRSAVQVHDCAFSPVSFEGNETLGQHPMLSLMSHLEAVGRMVESMVSINDDLVELISHHRESVGKELKDALIDILLGNRDIEDLEDVVFSCLQAIFTLGDGEGARLESITRPGFGLNIDSSLKRGSIQRYGNKLYIISSVGLSAEPYIRYSVSTLPAIGAKLVPVGVDVFDISPFIGG